MIEDDACYPIYVRRDTHLYRAAVHNLFTINVTFCEFALFGHNQLQLHPGDCSKAESILTYTSGEKMRQYCGKRYPWSIYSQSNKMELKLILYMRDDSTSIYKDTFDELNHLIRISVELGLVDPFPKQQWHPSAPLEWGEFSIAFHLITVDMWYKIRILVTTELLQASKFSVYDGPDIKMPKLVPYKMLSKKSHISPPHSKSFIYSFTIRQMCLRWTTPPIDYTHHSYWPRTKM